MTRLELLRTHLYDGVPVTGPLRRRGIGENRPGGQRRLPPGLDWLRCSRRCFCTALPRRWRPCIAGPATSPPLKAGRCSATQTVRDIVGALDVPLLTLAQQGTTAYQNTNDLLYRCEFAAPNDMWQG